MHIFSSCTSFLCFSSYLHLPVIFPPPLILSFPKCSLPAWSLRDPHDLIVFWCSCETYKCTQDSRPITYIFKTVHPGGKETEEKGRVLTITAVSAVYTLAGCVNAHKSFHYYTCEGIKKHVVYPLRFINKSLNHCILVSWIILKVTIFPEF